jgi:hypothetical protein
LHISLIAVIGILLLQWTGSIPAGSVGGSMTVGLAYIAGALAVGIHDAWRNRRGVLGWIVNLVVSVFSSFVTAPVGGLVVALLLSDGSRSLAASGGPRFSISLACGMLIAVLGSWGALWVVNRLRAGRGHDHSQSASGGGKAAKPGQWMLYASLATLFGLALLL